MVNENSKSGAYASLMEKHQSLFQCPLCKESMTVQDKKSLVCSNRHSYDLAKQGYVYLLQKPSQTKYDKALFHSRRHIHHSGLFQPLVSEISKWVAEDASGLVPGGDLRILDAGCGEGSHLAEIREQVAGHFHGEVTGAGIDIAKEGVKMAGQTDSRCLWCVADLANIPFADRSFHYILNILSPSNYREFDRLLCEGGAVIKVIPESGYLKELRQFFYRDSSRESYSNEETRELFHAHFGETGHRRLQYRIKLDSYSLRELVRMTPLTWNASEEEIQRFLETEEESISCDFTILFGRKNH